jgi:GTP pyrophosphokinase
MSDREGLAEAFKTELFSDTIYVLTPQGRVLALPHGATPIDFAYAIHTGLGNRCRGAKVEGQIVPLSTPLQNGQRVEVLTAKEGGPSVNWLHDGWVRATAPSPRSASTSACKMRIPCAKPASSCLSASWPATRICSPT